MAPSPQQTQIRLHHFIVISHQKMRGHCWTTDLYITQLGVSKNRGTPKSSTLIGFSIINHPFLGTLISGNTQLTSILEGQPPQNNRPNFKSKQGAPFGFVYSILEPQTTQSLHRKWLFHQTSIYKWLFGVPVFR